jgi:glycerol-3-phosphate dehydrogenase
MTPTKYIRHIEIAGIIKNIAAVVCGMADKYYGKGVHTDKIIKKACEGTWQSVLNLFSHLPADEFQNQVEYYTQHKDIIISSPGFIGDMILTCKQNQSRNYQFGMLIADEKTSIEDAKNSIGTVEGYDCCKTIIEHPRVGGEVALTTLLYEILESKGTNRKRLLKEFLQA